MSYSLAIGDNVKRNTTGATPWNVTAEMRHWKDSVKDFGGYWQGGGTYWTGDKDPLVSRQDAIHFFMTRLGSHIVRGGAGRWEGRITGMTLNLDGVAYRRDLARLVNRLQLVYTSYTGNGCLDGGAEISTLVADGGAANKCHAEYNGITTFRNRRDYPLQSGPHVNYPYPIMTLSTAWSTSGTRSIYLDCTVCEGPEEDDSPTYAGGVEHYTDLTAVPNSPYIVSCDIKIVTAGAYCSVAVEDANQQSQGELAYAGPGPGTFSVRQRIQTRDDASGALRVLVMSSVATGYWNQFYVDNVSVREFGIRKETPWQQDDDSIAEFGTQEEQVVVGGMTDTEALDWQDQILLAMAWPRTFIDVNASPAGDGLKIECNGYVTTLSNTTTVAGGVKECSQHITDLLLHSEFITAGAIEANAAEMYVDEVDPNRLWDSIQMVMDRGGTSGTRYIGGVYAGRKFDYGPRPATVKYLYRRGKFYNPDNSEAYAECMMPGIVYNDGWPQTTPATMIVRTSFEDDPRYVYVSAWEFDGDTNTATPIETRELLE